MTISTDRIMILVNHYRDSKNLLVATGEVVQELLALIAEEEDEMDSYYSAQAQALGYQDRT
jgi:hypothetical protein